MSENGSDTKIFNHKSVDIPAHQTPSKDEMLSDIWANVQMTNLKLYGDKEKKIIGITDELNSLNETMKPLVKDYERRKIIRRWILIPLTFIGGAIGTWAKEYVETKYLK